MTHHPTVPGPDHPNPQDDDPTPGGATLRRAPRRGSADGEVGLSRPTHAIGERGATGSVDTADVADVPGVAVVVEAAGRGVPGRARADSRRLSDGRRRARLPRSVVSWHERGRRTRDELAEAGMATAEYAIATLAAVGFAGLLVVILKGNEVKGLLLGIIRQALSS